MRLVEAATMSASGKPLDRIDSEARRVVAAAAEARVLLRLLGGLAVVLTCPSASLPPLARAYKDLDVVGTREERRAVDKLLVGLGYTPNEEFNALHGRRRLVYLDETHGRSLDVFLDEFVMCHTLYLGNRLRLADLAIPGSDLLLTKLQIVEMGESDLKDAIAILLDAEIDYSYVAQLLGGDWGWWRTVTDSLEKVTQYAEGLPEFKELPTLVGRVADLRTSIDDEPKSLGWRVRSRVGSRVKWYELPEEEQI